jgi:hypothetical protein
MEESEAMSNFQRYNQGNEKPGEPVFLYVSSVPAEIQEKGYADAFQKAKANAARLAKSADASLGRLLSLHKDDSFNAFDTENVRNYGGDFAQYLAVARQSGSMRPNATEAVGPTPDKIEHRVRVAASFELRGK